MFTHLKQGEGCATVATPQNAALNLQYTGQPQMNVRGPVTGSAYRFSPTTPVQPVDMRDARFLLASPLFRLSR
ncbi:MAG: hypothetical protein WCA21_13650 [Terracidiphilus sp.]|jgi:hypothetical protein